MQDFFKDQKVIPPALANPPPAKLPIDAFQLPVTATDEITTYILDRNTHRCLITHDFWRCRVLPIHGNAGRTEMGIFHDDIAQVGQRDCRVQCKAGKAKHGSET